MTELRFAENLYTFHGSARSYASVFQDTSAEEAALATIEATLVGAHDHYLAGRYSAAIDAYQKAAALIFTHLDPGCGGTRVAGVDFPLDAKLLRPLLRASLEWLNVLPVRQPFPVPPPREQVDPGLIRGTADLSRLGVVGRLLTRPESAAAVSSFRAARAFQAMGNTKAADAFLGRAQQLDGSLVDRLRPASETTGPARTTAPADGLFNATAGQAPLASLKLPNTLTVERGFGCRFGGQVKFMQWAGGDPPPLDDVIAFRYGQRVTARFEDLMKAASALPAEFAADLPHAYFYVIPLGLAECYHALGDYEKAERSYFQAAGYEFLNQTVEAPYLWLRLATLYLDWGSSLYRDNDPQAALQEYLNVLLVDATPPGSKLYTLASLTPGADAARSVIQNLAAFIAHAADPAVTIPDVNPQLAAVILEVHRQLVKISAGLDYWGMHRSSVPIWSFDFLQSVAINFTQLAIGAERDFIHFQEQADQSGLTRRQLAQAKCQANAELAAAGLQAAATKAEEDAYQKAKELADERSNDTAKNAQLYAASSRLAIQLQAVSAQVGGGEDGDFAYLNRGADALLAGQSIRDIDAPASLAAAAQLAGLKLTQQYEVAALNRQADEMNTAAQQAELESEAAQARTAAAKAATAAAQQRAAGAADMLDAFDEQFFTPQVWQRLADGMYRLYRRYLDMAITAARLMQRAYNFETDQDLRLIRTDYSSNEVNGLLAADTLMADIQTFTYDLITSTAGKPQPLRQTISLAESHGFAFENQLRLTGALDFETRIEEFDAYYPGTYAGRIEAVEVEVLGIVPTQGLSGTLTNGGISAYRIPSSAWTDPASNGLKYRVQPAETLVLSDYAARQDALLVASDKRMMRIFEGAGLASTWRLELPRAVNDIDFGALTDVRLTFYYKARFDPDLRDRVLAQLAGLPAANARQMGLPLRWLYPDAFFHFQDTGVLTITLKRPDFRRNQIKPVLTDVGLLVVTDGTRSAEGLTILAGTPTQPPQAGTTDAQGTVRSDVPDSPFAGLVGGTAVGDYRLAVLADDNPEWVKDGRLDLAPIVNIALLLSYEFTPRR